jgi:hypothetical protein
MHPAAILLFLLLQLFGHGIGMVIVQPVDRDD